MVVRGGLVTVQPHKQDGAYLKNNTQLGLNLQYMLAPNFGVELLAATPFKHDVQLDLGTGYFKAAEVEHLPPTISAVFYPLEASSPIQPYFGMGLNWTTILDEELTKEAKAAGATKLEVKDSVNFATQFGVDYVLPNNLIINAQVRHIKINTKATVHAGNTIAAQTYLDVDPTVYMVGVGYKF